MTFVAPRIVNDASCVMWEGSIMKGAFLVAGGLFGEVGRWLLLLGAL